MEMREHYRGENPRFERRSDLTMFTPIRLDEMLSQTVVTRNSRGVKVNGLLDKDKNGLYCVYDIGLNRVVAYLFQCQEVKIGDKEGLIHYGNEN